MALAVVIALTRLANLGEVRSGIGLSLAPWHRLRLVKGSEDEIRIASWSPPARDLYAVYPSRNYLSPKVRTFLDFVLDWVSPEPPWAM